MSKQTDIEKEAAQANGDVAAFPLPNSEQPTPQAQGLSKREWLAGMAMQGMLQVAAFETDRAAQLAVRHADAILRELERGVRS